MRSESPVGDKGTSGMSSEEEKKARSARAVLRNGKPQRPLGNLKCLARGDGSELPGVAGVS